MTISITNSIGGLSIDITQESITTVGSIKAIVIEKWGTEYKIFPFALSSRAENINSDKKLMEITSKKDDCIELKVILTVNSNKVHLDKELLHYCKGLCKNDYYRVNKDPFIKRIRDMITKGAYLDVIDDDNGFTPLLHAVRGGHIETVQLLINEGADVNKADKDGWTPLHYAARLAGIGDNKEILIALLNAEANVHLTNNREHTALREAWGDCCHMIAYRLILEKYEGAGREKGIINEIFLQACNCYDSSELVDVCLNLGANLMVRVNHITQFSNRPGVINENLETALRLAAKHGNIDVCRFLIKEKRVDVNKADKDGWTPLHYAAKHGKIEVFIALLGAKANVSQADKSGTTPLKLARETLEKSKDQGEAIKFKLLEKACKAEEEKIARTTIATQLVSSAFKSALEAADTEPNIGTQAPSV